MKGVKSLLLLFALLSLSAACVDRRVVQENHRASGKLPVVRWGYFPNYQPVYVGLAMRFFHEEGVDVQLVGNFNSGPAVIQAVGSGAIDAGHSAISGIANAVNSGVQIVGVADSQTESKSAPLMQWFVRADSNIRSAAHLAGKKIATNSLSGSFYYTVLIYLRQAGLGKGDVQFLKIPHNHQEQALVSGQIDVAGVIDPYSVSLAHNPRARVLIRAVDVIGERQFSLIFFTRRFVDEDPHVVEAFLRGYRRAVGYIESEPVMSSRVMSKQLRLPNELVVAHKYTESARVQLEDVQYWLSLMRHSGELKDGSRLKPTDIATTRFNPGFKP